MSFRFAAVLALGAAVLPATALAQAQDAVVRDARRLLHDLVAMRTAKGHGQVPRLAEDLAAEFRRAGFADEDIRILRTETGEGETIAAMIVRYRAADPGAAPPIALLGHMDVVDADPALWETDPFSLTEREGYWYGRGSADNKGAVAALASTLMDLKRSGWTPGRDVLLALSGDEESGSSTTIMLTRDPWLQHAEYAINTDAGGGQVDADGGRPVFNLQVAEKTSVSFTLGSRNRGGHSSAPRPDNALYDIADAIKAVQAMRFPVRIDDANRGMVEGLARDRDGELGDALAALLRDPGDAAARTVVERHPEDSHVLWTTCVPTMISGGAARNALPQHADLLVHCRIFPGVAIGTVHAALAEAVAHLDVSVDVDAARGSSPPSRLRADVMAAAGRAIERLYPGAELRASMSSGGSDGRYFRQAGIPTYGLDPMPDVRSVDSHVHGIGERLRVESFDRALPFWDAFLRDLAGAAPGDRARAGAGPHP